MISLRALEPEDLDLIYRIENDPEYWRFGASTVPYSRYALRQFIASSQNDLFSDGQVRLVIESDGKGVGFADLTSFDAIHLRAEIGLAVLPEHQGKHIGQAAVKCLCDYATKLHLHQIYAVISVGDLVILAYGHDVLYAVIAVTNEPATRLFRSLAFESSATLKDWLRSDEGYVDAVVWQKCFD